MSWPKGRPRPKKAGSGAVEVLSVDEPIEADHEPNTPPASWNKGMLLNVRNRGAEYVVTLYPLEYDPRHDDQCIKFTNLGECQNFVSAWYARQSHNPLAR